MVRCFVCGLCLVGLCELGVRCFDVMCNDCVVVVVCCGWLCLRFVLCMVL